MITTQAPSVGSVFGNMMKKLVPDPGNESKGVKLFQRFQKLWRNPDPSSNKTSPTLPDGAQIVIGELPCQERLPSLPATVNPTFEEHLKEQRFYEADQLLIEREKSLFDSTAEIHQKEEKISVLKGDRLILQKCVLQAVQESFSHSSEDLTTSISTLISAVKVIEQEHEQDRLWAHGQGIIPPWRPCHWMKLHDSVIQGLVVERMENPLKCSPPQHDFSSIMANILNMGRQMQKDLLLVVKVLKNCYTPQMDICNFYASQYHQIFSNQLSNITEFGLDTEDSTFLLSWVNEHYPSIFQKPELAAEINSASLGKLLSQELLESLVQQFLSQQESELNTLINKVLMEEKERFAKRLKPTMEDGCYVSPLAIDIIQLVNDKVTAAQKITGDQHRAQKLLNQLMSLLQSFRVFQEDVVKQNQANSKDQIKANLRSIEQFSDVLRRKRLLLSEEIREECLSILTDMKQSAQLYLLTSVRAVLKIFNVLWDLLERYHQGVKYEATTAQNAHYQKLRTSEWLNKNPFDKLQMSMEMEVQELQGLAPTCHQELMAQLYQEVTEEYVKWLLRGHVKLKGKEQQYKAYETVKDNAERLQWFFTRMGTQDDWLMEILTKIADLLRLQEVPPIQLEIVSLGWSHSDFSERHVTALLRLKPNLSKADKTAIMDTFSDTVNQSRNGVQTRPFFSKV